MLAKLFKKIKKTNKWFDVEYLCSDQVLTKSLINKMVNRLWLEKFKDVENSSKYLTIMFRVRLAETKEIKTITKLQRLRFESKEYLKSFIDLKAFMLQELYSNAPVSGVIFSYSINEFSKLRNDFIDTVYAEMGPVKSETLFHHYKNYKLPLSTELTNYGRIIGGSENFKNIKIDNKTNLNVLIENREDGFTYYLIDYIKNNNIKLSWEDKILNLEDDHLIRIIGQTIIEYKDNTFVSIKTLRKFQKIKKVKTQKKIKNDFIAGDLETILNKDKVMEPYLASFYQKGISGYEFNNNIEQLFSNYFKRILCRKNRGYDIYFHNLSGFDGFFILRYLIKFGYEISPLMHSGKLIQINVNKGRNSWNIKDSNLILLQSLKKLAKAFNLPINKGVFPYYLNDINYSGVFPNIQYFNLDKINCIASEYNLLKENFKNIDWNFKKEAIKYCLNDSKVLFNILESFNKLIFDRFGLNINKYPTTPSLAFAIFRSKYLVPEQISILIGKTKNDIQLGYTGGSTDMFIPSLNVLSKTSKKIHVYDVNSLYPSVMANNEFPIGDPTYIEYPNNLILDKNLDIFGFFYVKVVAPENILHPILQIKYNKRMVSGVGTFSGWFFSEELKNALKFGYHITIEKGYLFERGNIFKGFVDDLYSMRTSYDKSDPRNYIAKILLNSLYGRFGMTDIFSDIFIIEKKEFQDWTDNDKIDIEEIIEFDNKMLIKFKAESSLKQDLYGRDPLTANVNIAIAAAVTAYARIHMSQFKNNPNLPNLYYSDTDSLYFDGPLPDHMVDSNRLGALKLEGIWDRAVFLAPKVYALIKNGETIIKIKGLTKDAIKRNNITFEMLATLLSEDFKLTFYQNKWFKSLEKANIQILEQVYTLKVTGNKRELIYKNGKLVESKPILIAN